MERYFWIFCAMTVLEMGVIALYSLILPPADIFRIGLDWTHIIGHFSAYLVLYVSTYLALRTAPRLKREGHRLIAFYWSFGYSALMECLQLLTPSRQFEALDLAVNLVGVVAGMAVLKAAGIDEEKRAGRLRN